MNLSRHQFGQRTFTSLAFAITSFSALVAFFGDSAVADERSEYQSAIEATGPTTHWSFTKPIDETNNKRIATGAAAPVHKQFGRNNTALFLDNTARLEIPDEGNESRFDFDNGDEISVEAMVNPKRLADQAKVQ